MSKSLGNSPDPLDLIDKYGADGLRFGLMLIAPKGQDILFSEDRVEIGRNFMNKLWNASRFVMMNVGDVKEIPAFAGMTERNTLSLADKWILNRLDHTIKDVNNALDLYQFDAAARALYQFVWGEFCDWYLELAKTQIASGGKECAMNTKSILIHILETTLRLLHPYAPFITEEIWQTVAGANASETIMKAEFPKPPKKISFDKEAKEMQGIMEIVSAIRNIRGEHNVSPAKQIETILRIHKKEMVKMIEKDKRFIVDLCKISDLKIVTGKEEFKKCATAMANGVDIFVPLLGLIDLEAERTRLKKEIEKVEKFAASVEQKLSNKGFVDRAPKDVVEKERARLAEIKEDLKKFKGALAELSE